MIAVNPGPGLNQGLARTAGESAYPGLWKDLIGLWLPGIRTGGFGTTGEPVKDFSGNERHGTMQGPMTTGDWIYAPVHKSLQGYGLDLDGTDDFAELPGSLGGALKSGVTCMVWLNARGSSFGAHAGIFTNTFGGGEIAFFLSGNNTSLGGSATKVNAGFYDGTWNGVAQNGDWTFGSWEHIAGSYDGATVKLWINGVLNNSTADASGLITGKTDVWKIGERHDAGSAIHIDGLVVDARMYGRALTDREVWMSFMGASPLAPRRQAIGNVTAVTTSIYHHLQQMGAY